MTEKFKQFDLEDRTFIFAKEVRDLVRLLPRTSSNIEDGKQLIRSSGSVGANYIEANESFSKKDFIMRIKISRKEAKENNFWLRLLDIGENKLLKETRQRLCKESLELMNIFGAIIRKSEAKTLQN
jgi:four helix bundle protein